MYQLYHNKQTCELKLSKANKRWQNQLDALISDTPYYYNEYYTFCTKRNVLRELGVNIKMLWLAEAQMQVQKIENIEL